MHRVIILLKKLELRPFQELRHKIIFIRYFDIVEFLLIEDKLNNIKQVGKLIFTELI